MNRFYSRLHIFHTYATGLPITHRDILQCDKWSGKSNLGKIMMTIRRDINHKAK